MLVPWRFLSCLSLWWFVLACPLAVCPLPVSWRFLPCLSLGGLSLGGLSLGGLSLACPFGSLSLACPFGGLSLARPLVVCPLLVPWRLVPCLSHGSSDQLVGSVSCNDGVILSLLHTTFFSCRALLRNASFQLGLTAYHIFFTLALLRTAFFQQGTTVYHILSW